jgi:hypothetical protein
MRWKVSLRYMYTYSHYSNQRRSECVNAFWLMHAYVLSGCPMAVRGACCSWREGAMRHERGAFLTRRQKVRTESANEAVSHVAIRSFADVGWLAGLRGGVMRLQGGCDASALDDAPLPPGFFKIPEVYFSFICVKVGKPAAPKSLSIVRFRLGSELHCHVRYQGNPAPNERVRCSHLSCLASR